MDPARLARHVLVSPGGCRCALARSATCPTCTLPGHTCNHTVWGHICGHWGAATACVLGEAAAKFKVAAWPDQRRRATSPVRPQGAEGMMERGRIQRWPRGQRVFFGDVQSQSRFSACQMDGGSVPCRYPKIQAVRLTPKTGPRPKRHVRRPREGV